ncbi:MAG: serine/threonine-protein phosphatase [Ruminococcus sp.]|nr:serine/threonine-protein phosphatase [Ruminococcus sp.]
MNYYIYGYTDKGPYRLHNEDAMLINRVTVTKGGYGSVCIAPLITCVCDGVGGESAGELASQMCASTLGTVNYDSGFDLDRCIQRIHSKIIRTGISDDNKINMQTTLCLLAIDEHGAACCCNIGDSRMYRYVRGSIRQISVDQTYARFLYEKGEIASSKELAPELQSAIVSSVGSLLNEPQIEHTDFVTPFGEEEDDTVLICTDGLTDFITKDELEIAMKITSMTFSEKLEALCQLAIRNGSTDNVTILGIKPWRTPEEYTRITGTTLTDKKDEDIVRAQRECLEYQDRYETQKLEELSENSLAALYADLESFNNE